MATMFRYREHQNVFLKQDYPSLGLRSGDMGVVWALYELDSPTYEATFRTADGSDFDMTVTEAEVEGSPTAAPVAPPGAETTTK